MIVCRFDYCLYILRLHVSHTKSIPYLLFAAVLSAARVFRLKRCVYGVRTRAISFYFIWFSFERILEEEKKQI